MNLDYDRLALEVGRLMLRALVAEAELERLRATTSPNGHAKPAKITEEVTA